MSPTNEMPANLAEAAPVFAALGDATRLALLDRLSTSGPASITRLTTGSAVTRQAITKHLHVLAGAGLVHQTRRGRERIWELDPKRLDEAGARLNDIPQHWDQALNRLKAFVEE